MKPFIRELMDSDGDPDYIRDRLDTFFEEMVAGNLGFTSSAPAEGPVAGFDPVMRKIVKRKTKKTK